MTTPGAIHAVIIRAAQTGTRIPFFPPGRSGKAETRTAVEHAMGGGA